MPTKNSKICSIHFIENDKSQHPLSPNFNPTIYLSVTENAATRFISSLNRHKWYKTRKLVSHNINSKRQNQLVGDEVLNISHPLGEENYKNTDFDLPAWNNVKLRLFISSTVNGQSTTQGSHISKNEVNIMTNNKATKNAASGENSQTLAFTGFTSLKLEPKALKELTSIPINVFSLFLELMPSNTNRQMEVSREDRLLIFLIKLKLGISITAMVAYLGFIGLQSAKYFQQHSTNSQIQLDHGYYGPQRRSVIIDCSEIRTEQPPGAKEQALLYSYYKSAHTVKFLVGITPSGMISFVSKAYGGRSSDAFITNDSGFLNKLEPGDLVMTDKGLRTIQTELIDKSVILVMPPFASSEEAQFSVDSIELN